ncbi:uncharacterized protein [Procambarus clarkii]|uniref:uncharacterized protein n=1 Tax=Procambarus clarkii TaxID=6728 RepID=UPI003742F830
MSTCSTQTCFAEYIVNSQNGTQAAFIDLKSALDVAKGNIILEQLVEFGIKGNLRSWKKSYLSNKRASVLFKEVKSTRTDAFELGTPQGGVLRPILFNILMHKLIHDIPVQPTETVICYAVDICIMAHSKPRLQVLLDAFPKKVVECGFIISVDKTRVLIPYSLHANYTINEVPVENCESYKYLGVEVNDSNLISNLRKKTC